MSKKITMVVLPKRDDRVFLDDGGRYVLGAPNGAIVERFYEGKGYTTSNELADTFIELKWATEATEEEPTTETGGTESGAPQSGA